MDSLEKYAEMFDGSYPDYADTRYCEISKLIEIYDKPGIEELIKSDEFSKMASLIIPLIVIKKASSPFGA